MAHRTGPHPAAAPDRAKRRPHRPPAAWRQGSALPGGSAGAPRVDTFFSGTRSSSISVCLRNKRRPHREDALSPFICPTATIDDETGAFSDRLLAVLESLRDPRDWYCTNHMEWNLDIEHTCLA